MTQVAEWLDRHNFNIVTVLGTVAILLVSAIIILVLNRLLERWLSDVQGRLHLTDEINFIISRIVVAGLWFLTVFAVLNVWGVALSGILTVLVSILTIAGVGFLATWAMISNFTASFFLVLWRPFHFGQIVEIPTREFEGAGDREKSDVHHSARREWGGAEDSKQFLFSEDV